MVQAPLTGLGDRVGIGHRAMPRLGFGTYRAAAGKETRDAVACALEVGYRGLDTAALYGNEADVGEAVRRSGLPRDQVFVATKVWNDDQGYETTLEACRRSLRRLQMDQVDLYLVHWPIPRLLRDTWRAMEKIADEGMARSIGVCNFLQHHLEELLAFADIPPAVDQYECNPHLQQPELRDYCFSNGIAVQAWAPVMRGHAGEDPVLVRIGQAHGKSPEQVCLRWLLQLGACAIPKSVHAERIRANADVFDFELSGEEMRSIEGLDRDHRMGPHPDRYAV